MQTIPITLDRSPGQNSLFRRERHRREHAALISKVRDAFEFAGLSQGGADSLVAQIARRLDFERYDLAIFGNVSGNADLVLVVVPGRVWHSRDGMDRVSQLLRQAEKAGRICAAVPHTILSSTADDAGFLSAIGLLLSRTHRTHLVPEPGIPVSRRAH